MDTKELNNEQISAFVDGELSDAQADAMLAQLRTPAGMAAWDAYHLIGDVARSDEMAVPISGDFLSKFSARLEAEPTVIAPAPVTRPADDSRAAEVQRKVANGTWARRFALPALMLSVMAAIAFTMQPQAPAVVASAAPPNPASPANAAGANAVADAKQGQGAASAPTTLARDGDVVRDTRIDQFLGAHQRFSSQQSTEQFGRTAAFHNEADK